MRELNNSHLLRSIAKLIEKPEIKALEVSLITTLRELITADRIVFYQFRSLKNPATQKLEMYLVPVAPEGDGNEEELAPVLLSGLAGFSECLKTREMAAIPVTSASSAPRMRFIYPVIGVKGSRLGSKGITGFVVVENAEPIPRDQELITILLGFYRNYVSLLQDNQHDHLTGLLNRKSFDDHMMKIILSLSDTNKRKADKVNYCLAVLDIDHFKNVNDSYGHLLGDEVLLHFSQCMNSSFREYDLLFRVGGEKFVVVLKNVSPELANRIFERFRTVVENHYFPQVGRITTSIGVTTITGKDLPVTLIDRADQALYYAKNNGRNQVRCYEPLLAENKLVDKAASNDVELF
jgi:diguanylate cyclase (GGDEF)-like protein